ncbi:MAG: hypothetical protein EA384_11140 [Spirochaetaceae bacterium]|nr:MAG: hypothetical protein EA384_11140 [Spirochaetaceae bacterium]
MTHVLLKLGYNVPIGMMAGIGGTRTAMSEKDIRRAQIVGLRSEGSGVCIDKVLRQAMPASCRQSYSNFVPPLATEKPAENDELEVHQETSLRWLIAPSVSADDGLARW